MPVETSSLSVLGLRTTPRMIVRMQMMSKPAAAGAGTNNYKVHAEVQWRGPYGFLSGKCDAWLGGIS